MALIVVGLSHHTAPVDVRERCLVPAAEVDAVLGALVDGAGAREALVVSTCNRTEFYLVEGDHEAAPAVWDRLAARLGADARAYCYVRREREAVAHLFRVAAGMDSMILGETQIHGQVRTAWELGRGHAGAMLNRLFQTALLVSARVREETALGRGAASISSAAVQLARKIFGSLRGRHAMILGAGEMAELALECLHGEGVRTAVVANRTFDRARALADRFGATAIGYDECWPRVADVDVLVCSTAAPRPVVTVDRVGPAVARRGGRPVCILDIAVPRDVERAVGDLENVFLYDIDDLRAVVASNLALRREQLPPAEAVIGEEVERYWQWAAGLAAVPVVARVREAMDQVRERELAAALRRLPGLGPDEVAVVEQLSRALMNKFLHEPSVRLRAAAANGRGLGVVDAARYLFALDDHPPAGAHAAPAHPPLPAHDS